MKSKTTTTTTAAAPVTTTVAEIIAAVVDAPAAPAAPVKKQPKQFTFGVSEELSGILKGLQGQFIGPSITKPEGFPATEKELMSAIYQVAEKRRFEFVPVLDDEGNHILDADGVPEFKTLDHLHAEINREFALRKSKPSAVDYNDPEYLKREMARITAKLQSLGLKV